MADRLFVLHGESQGTKTIINAANLKRFLSQLILGSHECKADILFDLWDHDGDGFLGYDDIDETLGESISESKVSFR